MRESVREGLAVGMVVCALALATPAAAATYYVRADGNDHLHRFLTIADGVVRSQGRKIIFSTNLPNVGDLDEALIRPGRCFARIHVRTLTGAEAKALAEEIGSPAPAIDDARRHSLAEVYRALR